MLYNFGRHLLFTIFETPTFYFTTHVCITHLLFCISSKILGHFTHIYIPDSRECNCFDSYGQKVVP